MASEFNQAETTQLLPNPDLAQGARPLVRFGSVAFTGCDLSAVSRQVFLVTYWQFPQARPDLDLHVRFVLPFGGQQINTQHALDDTMLRTSLPETFFARGQRGQVWMNLTQHTSGQPVAATLSLITLAADGWLRICR